MFGRALKAATALILTLTAAGLIAKVRLGIAKSRSPSPALVRSLSIHHSSDGAVIIDIATTRPVPYRTLQLTSPERLVVDLEGADKALSRNVYPALSQILKRVRVAQWKSHPPIVRVVADLKGSPAFNVHARPSGIRVKLMPQAGQRSLAPRPHRHQSQSAWPIGTNKAETTAQKAAAQSPFTVHRFQDLTASLTVPEIPPQDRLVPIRKPAGRSPKTGPSATFALVSGISIKPGSGGRTYVDIASTRSVPYSVFQLANPFRLVIDLKNARNATSKDIYPVNSPVLKNVRIGQWHVHNSSVVRVVAHLKGYPVFDVFARRPGIRIDLRPRWQPGPLLRNPFEFATHHREVHFNRPPARPDKTMAAATNSPAVSPRDAFSDLKVIGYLEKQGTETQAIISDHSKIYFVPQGGTIENRFRVLSISGNNVQIQNIKTLHSNWLSYTP